MRSINEHVSRPFTQDEVVTLIKKIKHKQAYGIDNVINEQPQRINCNYC